MRAVANEFVGGQSFTYWTDAKIRIQIFQEAAQLNSFLRTRASI